MTKYLMMYPLTVTSNGSTEKHWAVGYSKDYVERWMKVYLPNADIQIGKPVSVITEGHFTSEYYKEGQTVWDCKNTPPPDFSVCYE